jgi:hypothetical protein
MDHFLAGIPAGEAKPFSRRFHGGSCGRPGSTRRGLGGMVVDGTARFQTLLPDKCFVARLRLHESQHSIPDRQRARERVLTAEAATPSDLPRPVVHHYEYARCTLS